MSAPQIPNLNSLRRGGLRGRGRGRGGAQSHDSADPARRQSNQDEIIQHTDVDAATSRISAVEAGYLDDPFAKLMSTENVVARRLPLMNRGTYVRTTGIDKIVDTFLSSRGNQRGQIISLGAGSDTRYFRLEQKQPDLNIIYHELDFRANTVRKICRVRSPLFASRAKALCGVDLLASEVEVLHDRSKLKSPSYVIHPRDLRELGQGQVALPEIDATLPSLIISECCLIYLSPEDADAVLQYFIDLFPPTTPLAIVIYEPIRPHDAFGRTMVTNLTARGIHLQTLEKYATLKEQRDRLGRYGFGAVAGDGTGSGAGIGAADVDFIWRQWIAEEEKERVEGLEWMDELEEFVLLTKHYSISWAWRGFEHDDEWRSLPLSTGDG